MKFLLTILESFRFEDEDDIQFYVLRLFSKNRHPGKLNCTFFRLQCPPSYFAICSCKKVIGDIRNKTWGFEFVKITVPVTSLTEQDFSLIQILFCALKWHRPRWVSCDQYPNIRSTASPISRVVHVMWSSFSLVSHHLTSYQPIIIHTYRLPYMRCLYA